MEIKPFAIDQQIKYNRFVESSHQANPLQLWEWGEIKTSKNWQVFRLGFWEKEKLVGAAQVLRRKLALGFYLYYIPYGPILDWKKSRQALDCLEKLKEYYKEPGSKKALFLKIEPFIQTSEEVSDLLAKAGFIKASKSIQPQHTAVVDLKIDSEKVFENFEKDTRYSIRRSEREEVEVKCFTNPLNTQPVKEFFSLYKTTSLRGRFPARPLAQFEKMWQVLAPQNQVAIYEAWFKDKILAAAFVLKLYPKAFLMYAGSLRDDLAKNKLPTYLLQWKIMESLKKEKFTSYDLWGVAPDNNPTHSWAGHTLFKRGFRGMEIEYTGSFDLPLSPAYKLFNLANKYRYFISGRKAGFKQKSG